MQTFFIKPKAGLIIRDPETFEQLNAKGEEKPQSSYWLKHVKNGDVELVETRSTEKTKKTTENA